DGVTEDLLPYGVLRETLASSMSVLDEVTVDSLTEIGQYVESNISDATIHIQYGLEDFVRSPDPEMLREGNLADQYKRSLEDSYYLERVKDQEAIDRMNFTSVKQTDFRRSPISDIRNYEQLLFGLYD